MIIDKLENAEYYYKLGERFKTAFGYLKSTDMNKLENGKYEIDGDNIFVSVQEYTTKPIEEGRWEAHRKYADIQFLIKGTEKLGYTDARDLIPETEYNGENDILFLKGNGQFAVAHAGDFLVFFPQDAHMPCISNEKQENVKKAVVKIKL